MKKHKPPALSERAIELRVCRELKARGVMSVKLNIQGNNGWPDRLFLHRGRAVFVEFKTARGRLTVLQWARLEQLRKDGFRVLVVRGVESGILDVLRELGVGE